VACSIILCTYLGRLDRHRKRSVLQFLYESGLIYKEDTVLDKGSRLLEKRHHIVSLDQADLTEADLSRVFLVGTHLRWINLSKANLRGAFLAEAALAYANVSEADLSGAFVLGTNLKAANLIQANLSGAGLVEANLFGTKLSGADLNAWCELRSPSQQVSKS
jgi:uncharacterized protein YjbI with pentapeptide repeats